MAAARGDHDYLMVDKALGRIILFKQDDPVFTGPALTGESLADRLPPNATKERFAKLTALETKVTPAGRYTVSRRTDHAYGTVLDINEIKGVDWGIAIHRVYVGNPAEHRPERLASPSEAAKHITFGCINVTPDGIETLLKEMPQTATIPLYILPEDDTQTASYFGPRTS